jgi:hypothetical protein
VLVSSVAGPRWGFATGSALLKHPCEQPAAICAEQARATGTERDRAQAFSDASFG